MIEIRMHGRGGNGSFTAAKLLGLSASVHEGKYAQAFPSFGPERRGAPVLAFTRISDTPIMEHSHVYECDCILVLDDTLCGVVDVMAGLKEGGLLLINTREAPETIFDSRQGKGAHRVLAIDAEGIALEYLGKPIVNTVMLGALLGGNGIVSFESLEKAIDEMLPESVQEKNKAAAAFAYTEIKKGLPT